LELPERWRLRRDSSAANSAIDDSKQEDRPKSRKESTGVDGNFHAAAAKNSAIAAASSIFKEARRVITAGRANSL
jgi:hypothetical protein